MIVNKVYLIDDARRCRVLQHENACQIVLNSLKFYLGWWFSLERLNFFGDLLQRSPCMFTGYIGLFKPDGSILMVLDRAKGRIGIAFVFANIGCDTRPKRTA